MRSIITKRTVLASIERSFEAYSNPALLAKWWGPHGFTNKFNAYCFEENGLWDYTMIDENGKEYHNQMIFQKIILSTKIIARHISAPAFEIEIDFIKFAENQTEIQFKMNFEDEAVYNSLVNYVPEKNEENFDRLQALL